MGNMLILWFVQQSHNESGKLEIGFQHLWPKTLIQLPS